MPTSPPKRELTKLNLPDPVRTKKRFGKQIHAARIKQDISRAELAKQTGIPYSSISAIESGQRFPSMAVYIVLCRALGIENGVGE